MAKRNLFAEMTEGFDALAAARKGKRTLRTTEVTLKPAVELSADELRAIREKLNLSRLVFASYLRTNPRTSLSLTHCLSSIYNELIHSESG
jgi:putative transcriptional regulator